MSSTTTRRTYEVTGPDGKVEPFTNGRKAWKRFQELKAASEPWESVTYQIVDPSMGWGGR